MTVKELYKQLEKIIAEGKGNYRCIYMDGNHDIDIKECNVLDDYKEVYFC